MTSMHFEIELKGNSAEIRDLQSKSGTYVNGQRVCRAELQNGDTIQAGRTLFGVSLLESLPETA